MSGKWGKKIFVKTLKHIFQKHFHYQGHDSWNFWNPHGKDKVGKRIIPTLRMVMSWGFKDISHFSDRDLVEHFLSVIKWNYPELYESKRHTVCKVCAV